MLFYFFFHSHCSMFLLSNTRNFTGYYLQPVGCSSAPAMSSTSSNSQDARGWYTSCTKMMKLTIQMYPLIIQWIHTCRSCRRNLMNFGWSVSTCPLQRIHWWRAGLAIEQGGAEKTHYTALWQGWAMILVYQHMSSAQNTSWDWDGLRWWRCWWR